MRKFSTMLIVALMATIMALQFGCKTSGYEVKKDAENGGVAAVTLEYTVGACYGADIVFEAPEGFTISQQPKVYDGDSSVSVGTSANKTAMCGYGETSAQDNYLYVYMKDTANSFNSLKISVMFNIDSSVAVGEYNVKATIKNITSVGSDSSRNLSSESSVVNTKITLVG